MEQWNLSQVLMWLTRACVLWLLCTSLSLFFYPWATLASSLFFEHANCAGIPGFCSSCFWFAVLLQNLYVWHLIVIQVSAWPFLITQRTETFQSFLTAVPCFIFVVIILSEWCRSTISYLFNSHLSFWLQESWFYLG